MNGSLLVLSPGIYTTIQDQGRKGYRRYGVPSSGVMDQQSAELANHLLNNPINAALLEITLSGPKLMFLTSTQICITGADMSARLNEMEISLNQVVAVSKDDVLSFGKLKYGARTYLAVKDGFQVNDIMGSKSFYHPVTQHSTLQKGEQIPIRTFDVVKKSFATVKIDTSLFTGETIDCYKGPEFSLLTQAKYNIIFQSQFNISAENNRMGYRLKGEAFAYPSNYNMLTSAVLPGTVQLTPSGQLIVLMQDCQTTGGYPRILQLTQSGINKLSQKRTGDTIRFSNIIGLNEYSSADGYSRD